MLLFAGFIQRRYSGGPLHANQAFQRNSDCNAISLAPRLSPSAIPAYKVTRPKQLTLSHLGLAHIGSETLRVLRGRRARLGREQPLWRPCDRAPEPVRAA